jgi:hypothetical protein
MERATNSSTLPFLVELLRIPKDRLLWSCRYDCVQVESGMVVLFNLVKISRGDVNASDNVTTQ